MIKRPNILTIGGFDPSAGAGILADIKTIETIGGYGFACNTANTVQSENNFVAVNWVDESIINAQMDELAANYEIDFIKVGLLPDFKLLLDVRHCFPLATVIWDPILSASAGYSFSEGDDWDTFLSVVDIVTPNYDELKTFAGEQDSESYVLETSNLVTVVLKGGHHPVEKGVDHVFQNGKKLASFSPESTSFKDKHGTGCIFSSALTTYLAMGNELTAAVQLAKKYLYQRANSNSSKLAYHNL